MKKAIFGMAMLALAACNGGQPENPLMADSALPYGAPEYSLHPLGIGDSHRG